MSPREDPAAVESTAGSPGGEGGPQRAHGLIQEEEPESGEKWPGLPLTRRMETFYWTCYLVLTVGEVVEEQLWEEKCLLQLLPRS